MKKNVIRLIVAFITVFLAITPISTFAAIDESMTPVTLRLSLYNYLSGASCNVTLERFANATDKTPIDSGSAPVFLSISRSNNWELTVPLPDGFYEVTYVSVTGRWDDYVSGCSPRFEVKGQQMTVYIAVDNPEHPAPMPENWLVYGKDTQNFYIWDESTTEDEPSGEVPSTTQPVTTDTLPEQEPGDKHEITTTDPTSPPATPETTVPTTEQHAEPLSVQIGDYVYIGFALILLFASLLLYIRTQKKRGA